MDSEPVDPAERFASDQLVISEEGGVRVFWVVDSNMQGLTARLALVLSERMHDGDDMTVTYNAMQTGWVEHPAEPGGLRRGPARPAWTELVFEYSALVVLRQRTCA